MSIHHLSLRAHEYALERPEEVIPFFLSPSFS
jgi:hypothetical protein